VQNKNPENALEELNEVDVTELDDKSLEEVSGGVDQGCTNGNCNGCDPGTKDPNGCANANCST
jgi:hypothetical protein